MLLVFALTACDSIASVIPTVISATATLSPPGVKRIAFYITSDGSSKSGIYVVNADGSHLTHLAKKAAKPVWSPDGRYIAFVSGGIYVMNADGTHQVHLADLDVNSNLAWSPNSLQIILSTFSNDGAGKIYLINNIEESLQGKGKLGGSYIRLNLQGVNAHGITWSPDGRQIAFFYRRDLDPPDEIAVLNVEEALQSAEGGVWTTLTEGETPVWSPDGQHIAFMAYQGDYPGIEMMDANGDHQTRLANNATDPAWSPDGQRIAFFSNRASQVGLYVMNADGSNPTRLTETQNHVNGPAWSLDGQQIAFISGKGGLNGSLYVINADGSHLLRLTDASLPLWPQVPMWAPQ